MPPSQAGVRPSVGDGDASAQPNASSTSCTDACQRDPRLVRIADAVLDAIRTRKSRQLRRDHLLLQELLAERAVAPEQRLAAGRRRNQELAVALRVQDVQRHGMNVGRRQLAERRAAPGRRRTAR